MPSGAAAGLLSCKCPAGRRRAPARAFAFAFTLALGGIATAGHPYAACPPLARRGTPCLALSS